MVGHTTLFVPLTSIHMRVNVNFLLPASLLFGRSRLLLCALLPIYVPFSDLSKILTSADQHNAQTTHFGEKEDSLPPTTKSLHSRDGKTQLPTF